VQSVSASFLDTIVAGNASSRIHFDVGLGRTAAITSQGYNLIGVTDDTTGWVASDLTGAAGSPLDPQLGPLQDNGGPTQTMALLPGSPALGAGSAAGAPALDQRGAPRLGRYDIGAYQASAYSFDVSAPATVTPGAPFAVTVTARDVYGNVAVGYTGTVYLNSSDPLNPYLDAHAFTAAGAGTFTFTGEQLFTAGVQTLLAFDGFSEGTTSVTVVPGAVARPPAGVPDGAPSGVAAYLGDASEVAARLTEGAWPGEVVSGVGVRLPRAGRTIWQAVGTD
jgi:hypothetical protein